MRIVLASSNEHKVKEINAIVNGYGVEFVLPPAGFDPVEDGTTFEENSYIKARAAGKYLKHGHWRMIQDFVLMRLTANRGFIPQDMPRLRKSALSVC